MRFICKKVIKMKNYKTAAFVLPFLLIFITFLPSFNAHGQIFKASVSSGFVISQIDGDELYGFKHVGYTGGMGVMVPFSADKPNEGFQVSTEILLTQRGAKNKWILDPFGYKCNLNYIDIPFMIHYVDKRAGAAFGVGVQYGRLISSKEEWILSDTVIRGAERPLVTTDHSFIMNDFSVVADFRFNIWKNLKFDVRYQYSLAPIRKDFWFYNSNDPEDLDYLTWKRDYKSNYISFKLIYVINEVQETYRTKPNRLRR